MAEKTLIAGIGEDESDPGIRVITSPVVAMADGAPRVGVVLNPFDRVITMKVLNQRYVLRLPRDVHGRVTEALIPNAYTPVAYGQSIARIDPRALEAGAVAVAGTGGRGQAGTEAADTTLITVPSPSEGIFYRRPSPDSPPYVDVGSEVTPGKVMGLVEIMKCFYQITYDGPGLPPKGQVVKILAEDVSEVQFGQPLFRIQPVE